MKLTLTALLILITNISTLSSDVYICVSKTATKYHYDKNCKGLNKCTHKIKKVPVKEASNLGYSLCGWEK